MKQHLAILAVAAMASVPTNASASYQVMYASLQLLCTHTSEVAQAQCFMYERGLAEGLKSVARASRSGDKLCIPDWVSATDIEETFADHWKMKQSHLQDDDKLPAIDVLVMSLRIKYPCPHATTK